MNFNSISLFAPILMLVLLYQSSHAQSMETITLWPEKVPGEKEAKRAHLHKVEEDGSIQRLTDITNPAMVVFEPEDDVNNSGGVIICPGGGYSILAIEKEGYEIAEWLNKLGFTAFVLQYRIPQKQAGALNDLQRAIRIVRSQAAQWKLDPEKLGVLGFSAGGDLAARGSTLYQKQTYPRIDEIDTVSCRPDFAVLIYPAYLDGGKNRKLSSYLAVDTNTPPMFIFATADDKHANSSLVMATALRDSDVPVDLHLPSKGGHGYGLRKGNPAAETWPLLAEKWLGHIILIQ